jgi:hypothetical protein
MFGFSMTGVNFAFLAKRLTYFLKPLNFYLTWQLKSDFKDTEVKRGLSIL